MVPDRHKWCDILDMGPDSHKWRDILDMGPDSHKASVVQHKCFYKVQFVVMGF